MCKKVLNTVDIWWSWWYLKERDVWVSECGFGCSTILDWAIILQHCPTGWVYCFADCRFKYTAPDYFGVINSLHTTLNLMANHDACTICYCNKKPNLGLPLLAAFGCYCQPLFDCSPHPCPSGECRLAWIFLWRKQLIYDLRKIRKKIQYSKLTNYESK